MLMSILVRIFLWLLLICGISFFVEGQDTPVLNLEPVNPSNAVLHSSILSLYQDTEGFLWIGSGAGLARYDGYDSRFFKALPGRQNALAGNTITDLAEDTINDQRVMWVACKGGLSRINLQTDEIYSYPVSGFLPHPFVFSLLNLGSDLWIGTGAGLCCLDTETDSSIIYPAFEPGSQIGQVQINDVFKDPLKNWLWLATGVNLVRFDLNSHSFKQWDISDENIIVASVNKDVDQNIWATSKHGLLKYERAKDSLIFLPWSGQLNLKDGFFSGQNPYLRQGSWLPDCSYPYNSPFSCNRGYGSCFSCVPRLF